MSEQDWKKKFSFSMPVYLGLNIFSELFLISIVVGIISFSYYLIGSRQNLEIIVIILLGLLMISLIIIYWIYRGYQYIVSYVKNYALLKDYYFLILDHRDFEKDNFFELIKSSFPKFQQNNEIPDYYNENTILKMSNMKINIMVVDIPEMGSSNYYCFM